jgi:hypothetical protein
LARHPAKLDSDVDNPYSCYGRPGLICPREVNVAYIEIPRTGCTSMKQWLAHIDGMRWDNHTFDLRCCKNASFKRVYTIVRHPLLRLLSLYNHHYFCKNKRFKYCKQRLNHHNIDDFEKWVFTSTKKFSNEYSDKDGHYRSQYHFIKESAKQWNVKIFKIENMNTEFWPWMKEQCNQCVDLYTTQNVLDNNSHDLSLVYDRPHLLKAIRERFKQDYKLFNYSDHILS